MFPKAAVGYRQIEVARRLLVLEQTAQRGTWSRLAGWGALKVGLFMGSSGLPASPSPTAATTTSTDIFVRNLYMHALVAPAMTSQEPCMLLCTGRGGAAFCMGASTWSLSWGSSKRWVESSGCIVPKPWYGEPLWDRTRDVGDLNPPCRLTIYGKLPRTGDFRCRQASTLCLAAAVRKLG